MDICAVDCCKCDGLCREHNRDGSGKVCCSECFSMDEAIQHHMLSRHDLQRQGLVRKKESRRRMPRHEDED
jgi:hypothetical protein